MRDVDVSSHNGLCLQVISNSILAPFATKSRLLYASEPIL